MAMKLLAADYDGTLKLGEEVTSRDIEAIRKWRQKGNLFVIDTGRSMQSILAEVRKYDIPVDYFITNNGGMVFDAKQHELFSSYIDPLMSLDIMYLAKEIGNVVSYVSNDGYYRHRVIVDETLGEKRYPGLKPDLSEEELMASEKHAQFVISMATKKRSFTACGKNQLLFFLHGCCLCQQICCGYCSQGNIQGNRTGFPLQAYPDAERECIYHRRCG